jgi:hypothetical protein
MNRFISIISVLLLLVFAVAVTNAQDEAGGDGSINYGDPITGELTDREFEVEYYFEGRAGDVIIAAMGEPVYGEGVGEPALMLLDPDFDVIGANDTFFGEATIATILLADGEYTLIATRQDGRAGEEVGPYYINFLNPDPVTESLSTGTIDKDSKAYYVVQSDELFGVGFVLTQATFLADMAVYGVEESGSLERIAVVDGNSLGGVVFIDPDTAGYELFIITIEDLGFTFRDATAEYGIYLVNPLEIVPLPTE